MTLKMFQKNILKLSLNESLSIVLLCGFLFPKFSFLNYNISIPDLLACIFAITLLFKIKHIKLKIFEIFKFEILILMYVGFIIRNTFHRATYRAQKYEEMAKKSFFPIIFQKFTVFFYFSGPNVM